MYFLVKKMCVKVILPSLKFMKRLLSFLALLLIGGSSFEDVDVDYDYVDAIEYLYDAGVIEGYSDGTYRPDNKINRAEFVKILVGAKYKNTEFEQCASGYLNFSDIDENEWYAEYLCIAKSDRWIEGYSNGTFKPANSINFVEAAKIVSIAYGQDESTDEIWYKPYVEFLEDEGAIPASIGSFASEITRGEMAEMIYRVDSGEPSDDSQSYEDLETTVVTYADTDYGYGEGLLPLGDDKVSSSAKVDYIYSCNTALNGGGAFASGDWLNEALGYWDPSLKPQVDGSVAWNGVF